MKNKIYHLLEKHQVTILLAIVLFAFLLRFINITTRWSLGDDTARDIAIAKEAIAQREIPLVGSFSSAGPFVFGPMLYHFIMAVYLIFPFSLPAPFYVQAFLSSVSVIIFFYIGKNLKDNILGYICAVLAASSPQLVIRSTMLAQHSFIPIFASLAILCYLLYLKHKKIFFSFLAGLCIGAALNMHYQALNLLIFAPCFFLGSLKFREKAYSLILFTVGIFIPMIPLLVWDSYQNFSNIRNMLYYLLIDQYRFYVPNSWRLFLFNFFPSYWGFVVGGSTLAGMIIGGVSGITLLISFVKKVLSKEMMILCGIFGVLFIVNRYYHGERSESYLLYLLPFIIILSSFAVYNLIVFKNNLYRIGSIVIALLLISSLNIFLIVKLNYYKESTVPSRLQLIETLSTVLPGNKYRVYDYMYKTSYISQELSTLLVSKQLEDEKGIPIGVCTNCPSGNPILINENVYKIIDLRNYKALDTKDSVWGSVSQKKMYSDLIGWSKKHPLKSDFNLIYYLQGKYK